MDTLFVVPLSRNVFASTSPVGKSSVMFGVVEVPVWNVFDVVVCCDQTNEFAASTNSRTLGPLPVMVTGEPISKDIFENGHEYFSKRKVGRIQCKITIRVFDVTKWGK